MTPLRPAAEAEVSRAALLAVALLALFGCSPTTPDPREVAAAAQAPVASAPDPERLHALLLNGGGRPRLNYYSHLDHLRRLLELLEATGVDPARIAVFSADGPDPAADLATREGILPGDFWLLPRSEASRLRPPLEYVDSEIAGFALRPATRDALRGWFEDEGRKLAPGDTLLFYVTDHGEKNEEDPTDNTITLWGEELSVGELRELLALLAPGVRVVMLMSQCYSGSFANAIFPDGAESSPDGSTCGYFSAPADRKAHGCYPEASGREASGHSHRIFDALASVRRLPEAQREVLLTDGTPDVPHATSSFFLAQRLERAAQAEGQETAAMIDRLLSQAWEDPLRWEREIRLIDRVGQTFGFASARSLESLEAQAQSLSELRERLDTYADRWDQALDALRQENLAAFRSEHPAWKERLAPDALKARGADGSSWRSEELLEVLAQFTAQHPDRQARLRDLHWKAEEANAARYRADVRLAAVLRMRTLLTEVAGRYYMARYASAEERAALAGLEACEDLALVGPEAARARISPPPEPFPTLAEERRQIERVLPAWLGVHYRAPRASEHRRFADLPSGASVVTVVLPDSPAAAAGLQVADIALGPPGEPFQERHAMREWVMQGEIGRPKILRVLRDGEEQQVTIRLAPYPLELPRLSGPPQIGSAAPALDLEYLAGARPPEPGRSRLVFFWATWCGPCKQALPELMAFGKERGVPVVAVTDESQDDVETFFRSHGGPRPEIVASDRRRVSFERYGVSGTPTFVLVDARGIVRHYATGYDAARGLGIDGWRWDGRAAAN